MAKKTKSKGPINTQADVDVHHELGREQLESQLYQPKAEIEGLDLSGMQSATQRLISGLDKLQPNHMMMIRGSDRPTFYK